MQATSPDTTQVGDLVLCVSWHGTPNATGSVLSLRQGENWTQVFNFFHNDAPNQGAFAVAWKLAQQPGAQVYQAFDTTSPHTDCRTALRVYEQGTFDLDLPASPALADIITKANADLLFSQHTGLSVQAYSASAPLQNVAETGIHGTILPNGETMRFGKVDDPIGQPRKAFLCQVHSGDPLTSGGRRVEILQNPAVLQWGKTYWAAFSVFIHDWGTLTGADDALFGCQVHTGSAETVGGPSISLIDEQSVDGRSFQVKARWSPGPAGQFAANAVVTRYSLLPIPFGQWVNFVYKFRHSDTNGLLQVWMNGSMIADHQAPLGYNTGFDDYAKFGYYNFGTMNSTPRKVLVRGVHVIHDPTGNTYTLAQMQGLLDQPGIRSSVPTTFISGSTAPNPGVVTDLNSVRDYLIEAIGGWWNLSGDVNVLPGAPSGFSNLIETIQPGWLELAIASQAASGVSSVDPGAFTDNVDSTVTAGTIAATLAIRGSLSQRSGRVGFVELEVPVDPFRKVMLSHVELEAPDPGGPRRAIIGQADLIVPDYSFPSKIGFLFHRFWSRYRYRANNPGEVTTRQARVGHVELEVPEATRRSRVSWAELEMPSPPSGTLALGRTTDTPTTIAQFEAWLGRPQNYISVWPARSSWAQMSGYNFSAYTSWLDANPSRFLNIAIAMLPSPNGAWFLDQVANGLPEAEACFRSTARNIRDTARNRPHQIRIGWEYNGNWYPWRMRDSNNNLIPRNANFFVPAFRKIHDWMIDEVPNNQWRFANCFTTAFHVAYGTPENFLNTTWPGDSYVDEIGMDFYDRAQAGLPGYPIPAGANASTILSRQTQAVAWTKERIDIVNTFAKAHGNKPLSFDEWGVNKNSNGPNPNFGSGGGDNPLYIQMMYNVFTDPDYRVAAHSYLDGDPGSELIKISPPQGTVNFPNAQALFKQLFGG